MKVINGKNLILFNKNILNINLEKNLFSEEVELIAL